MTATRAEIVAAARALDGARWRHQGRSPAGVDCVGLVVLVCRGLGLSDYDSTVYGRDPDPTRFLGHFTEGGATRINPRDAQDGDLIIFHQAGYPCHAGIRSTRGGVPCVVHAHLSRRRVVEEPLTAQAPIAAAYRLPNVEAA